MPHISKEVIFLDYIGQRVELQTELGVVNPLYVLIPRQGKG